MFLTWSYEHRQRRHKFVQVFPAVRSIRMAAYSLVSIRGVATRSWADQPSLMRLASILYDSQLKSSNNLGRTAQRPRLFGPCVPGAALPKRYTLDLSSLLFSIASR
jgi:hypothetical protein